MVSGYPSEFNNAATNKNLVPAAIGLFAGMTLVGIMLPTVLISSKSQPPLEFILAFMTGALGGGTALGYYARKIKNAFQRKPQVQQP